MGYFSNGAEGSMYQEQYCCNCYHDLKLDCKVWLLHLVYNGNDLMNPMLEKLIPVDENGHNGKCSMFVPNEILKEVDTDDT